MQNETFKREFCTRLAEALRGPLAEENVLAHIDELEAILAPEMTRDPAFEVAYWRFGLRIALRWAEDLGVTPPAIWREVCENMSLPPVHEGLYVAHAEASDSFKNHLDDHPSMLQCLGFLPGWGVDPEIMDRTLATVLEKWDYSHFQTTHMEYYFHDNPQVFLQ